MSAENKYYTPSIEEFYVGFQYEYYHIYDEESGDEEDIMIENPFWKKEIIKDSFDISWIDNKVLSSITTRKVRVKYLDESDIKSLGFKQDYEDEEFSFGDWYISYYSVDKQLEIYKEVDDTDYGCHPYEYYFQGVIKNKSELKRLLKQLGIDG